MMLDPSLYWVMLGFLLGRRRLVSYNVASTFSVSSWQAIETLPKSIAWHHGSLWLLGLIKVIEHKIQICVCHLLQMIYNVLVSIDLDFKVLLLVSRALSWELIWPCQSWSMLVFWRLCCNGSVLLRSPALGPEVKYSWDPSAFGHRMMLVYLSSGYGLPLFTNTIGPCGNGPHHLRNKFLRRVLQNDNALLLVLSCLGIKEIDSCLCDDRRQDFIFLQIWAVFNADVFLKILTKRHSNHGIVIAWICLSSLLGCEEIRHRQGHTCKLVLKIVLFGLLS